MRKVFTFLLLITGTINVTAQENLIKDPSFEDYRRCPDGITESAQRFPLKWWYLPTGGTPEYYNICSDNISNSIPKNNDGFQNPHSGNGYVGMTCWPTFCEYVQTELINPLNQGSVYYVEFWVNMADISGKACTKIGAYFDNSKMQRMAFEDVLDVCPQVCIDSIIKDTAQWVKVSGKFQAKGGERYITVGCFASNKKEYISISYNKKSYFKKAARYNIDDVCVKKVREDKPFNCDEQPLIARDTIIQEMQTFTPGEAIILPDITFAVNKWELQENIKPLLDSLSFYLRKNENYALTISGHTDNSGTEHANQTLSENRARAVQEYLSSKGVQPERITVKGYGSSHPIADNEAEAGKAKNRRVEIVIQE